MFTYSFWADEAFVSSVASQLVRGQMSLAQALSFPGITYQRLNMLTIAVFFKLFGVTEFSARLPSMLAFLIGILLIFLVAKRLGNVFGASIAAFLYGASHLNLAYATQAKPYAGLETLTLAVILTFTLLLKEKRQKQILFYNALLILLCMSATLLHVLGLLLWTFYFVYIFSYISHVKFNKRAVLTILIPTVLVIFLAVGFILPESIKLIREKNILANNHLGQVVRLFGYQYFFICFIAFLGFCLSFVKEKSLSIAILLYGGSLLVLATFEQYVFNVRYVLSLFGIIFLYFGIFWGAVVQKYFKTKMWIVPLTVILILCITGYKINRAAYSYFDPNIDRYGDIQTANYKDFYLELKQRHPDYKKLAVFNDVFDVEEWYFGRYSNAYFMKSVTKPQKHPIVDATIYGSLDDFKREMRKHPRGLVIVEEWQSFFPDDIKDYVKKNLKLEYRVESLKEAPHDPWPLALYSWGM